jgi:hypothetical protein
MSFYKGLIGLLFVLSAVAQAASNWDSQAAQLAKQIVAISGPGTASLSIKNNSSLAGEEIPAIRRALEVALRDSGVQLRAEENAATALRVTLSENVRGWLWVAEVQQGSDTRVAMIEVQRQGGLLQATPAQTVSLKKALLWSQPEPMMDAAVVKIGLQEYLAVLESSRLVLYRTGTSKPEAEQTLTISTSKTVRDPRGRLIVGSNHPIDVYLAGMACSSNASLPLSLSCKESDDPWPIGSQKAFFNSSRNYFTGAMAPGLGRQIAPFYSAAELPRSNYSVWVFAGVNGQFRAADKINDVPLAASATRDWGSDIATLHGCGNATYLMATSAGTGDQEAMRAYEMTDRDPLPVSMPLEFAGPVTALWSNGAAATVVARNNRTNSYEAYSVTVACSQ